jgi:rhodanese-related sulfurtransferase
MAEFISPEELQLLLEEKRAIYLLDVRRKHDYESAPEKIEPAKWVDPEKKDEWINSIPKGQDVVVYCVKGGAVSQSVADYLVSNQYHSRFLQGGIKAWTEMKTAQKDANEPLK